MKCLTTTGYDDARTGCDIKDRRRGEEDLGVEKTNKEKNTKKKIKKVKTKIHQIIPSYFRTKV